MKAKKVTTINKLPEGITSKDLQYPDWKTETFKSSFELWYTERFEWCIPTLLIRSSRKQDSNRTYGITVKDGQLVTIGSGPHVKERVRVYVRATRVEELKKYTDLLAKGLEDANQCRDTISTRRANTALRRSTFGW